MQLFGQLSDLLSDLMHGLLFGHLFEQASESLSSLNFLLTSWLPLSTIALPNSEITPKIGAVAITLILPPEVLRDVES